MMSLVKAVPGGIKDKEFKRFALQECYLVPYVLEKDPVQETLSALKSEQSLKTIIWEDAELHLPIWHCSIPEAFLMHMSTAIDGIKKQGTFKAHKEASEAYVEQRKAAKQVKATLAILNAAASNGEKISKKASEKAPQKAKESMALADDPDLELCGEYQANYEKAKAASETAKNKREAAATEMFQFYVDLLSADAKYTWIKIIKKQTEADPFMDLQGVSRKGPRGLFCKLFNDCIMFHRLTVIPNNAAEQKITTFSTCSRSPSGLAYTSLYSA
jgi:hypothetical protein